jgi:peroxidase
MPRSADVTLLFLVAVHALLVTHAALQEGFYTSNTDCTVDVEATVASVVQQFISADRGVGAGLIRPPPLPRLLRQGNTTCLRI